MNDEQLRSDLLHLGIDAGSYRALLLLPLVQVAWADGEIQDAERDLILATARERDLLSNSGGKLLLNWLRIKPTEATFLRARSVLLELVHRTQGLGSDLGQDDVVDICTLCEEVASVAGGFFGLAFTVSEEEHAAISDIARELNIGPAIDLASLSEDA